MNTKSTRLQISDDDLKDIKPASPLYWRVTEALAEFEDGAPYRAYARDRLNKDGELEFDDDATVSLGADDGAYIAAWVWVSDDDLIANEYLERCDECEAVMPEDAASLVNKHHLPSCSLFSNNKVNDAEKD